MAEWRDNYYADQNLRMAAKMLEQQGEVNALKAEVASLTTERDRLREDAARYPVPAVATDLVDMVADAIRPYLQVYDDGDDVSLVTAESAGDLADVALTALISAVRLPGVADEHVMFEYNVARDQVARFAEKQLALQAERDAARAELERQRPVIEAARAWREDWRELETTPLALEHIGDRTDHALAAAVDALPSPTPGSDHPFGTSAAPGEESGT